MNCTTLVLFQIGTLRLADQPAFRAADRGPVVPAFLWTPSEDGHWAPGAASRWWLHGSLSALDQSLRERGSRLIIRHGSSTVRLVDRLLDETGATRVTWEQALLPAERARESELLDLLRARNVEPAPVLTRLLVDPWAIKRASPFHVYSAYWRAARPLIRVTEPAPAPRQLPPPRQWPASEPLDSLELLPRPDWAGGLRATWQPGEVGAQHALTTFLGQVFARYALDRNLPAADHTSRLSPYLHFGELSVSQLWRSIDQLAGSAAEQRAAQRLSSELGWREFAHYVLAHVPRSADESLDTDFDAIDWRSDRADLRAWQRGQTGYPLVDAGMRQLWQTGWMHNRVRMAVASFLVKDLLLPWQAGARWFWDTLVDADLANNTLGWQWSAGCGFDAAPFIRVFNPTLQAERFDPRGDYIRRYVPELRGLDAPAIHRPWEAPPLVLAEAGVQLGTTYPFPIVEHAGARRRALAAFGTRRLRTAT